MKSTYILEGLQERNLISDIAVALHDIDGVQLVSFDGTDNQLTIEYNDLFADTIIRKTKALIKKLDIKAILKNL
jgi:hypothetical protein